MASDNLLEAFAGALQGAQNIAVPYFQMAAQAKFNRAEKQAELGDEFSMFQKKLPLETQSKIDIARATPTNILSPTGQLLGQYTGKVQHLGFAPGSGSKVDTRTIGQLKAAGEGDTVPAEFQNTNEFDSYRVPEATQMLTFRANQSNRQDVNSIRQNSNTISAGKTGVFQGLRNSIFGTPGTSQSLTTPSDMGSQSSVPSVGTQFGGAKVLKVVKVK